LRLKLTSNAAEAFAELRALLRLVRDDLQVGSKVLVVVGEPLEKLHLLFNFQLETGLNLIKINFE
jgi:hypothetical protein